MYTKNISSGCQLNINADILSAGTYVGIVVMLSFFLSPTAFSPLQAARNYDSMARPQFRLLDLAVLCVQIQLLTVLLISTVPDSHGRAVALTWLGIPLGLWWFGGVRLLTCARIERTWSRIFFLSVVAPLGFLMSLSLTSSVFLLMSIVYAFCVAVVLKDASAFVGVLALTIFVGAVIGILMLIRSTCRMLVANYDVSRL